MANLKDSPNFQVYDDYYTPKSAWERVGKSIRKQEILVDKVVDNENKAECFIHRHPKVWEACMLGADLSKSDQYLTELGCEVIADRTMNCLEQQPEDWDIIITNIPFDKTKKIPILERFVELDKPFMVIMNSMNTFTKYFHRIFKGKEKDLQIITPSKKINFDKLENGVLTPTKNCSFYSVYVCYKFNLPPDHLWID